MVYSAIIYVLRALIATDIPMNQGCLTPITVILPQRTLLSPSPEAAVVGGNCVTSQRVTDVILRALDACAASQGCLNNLTFGVSSRVEADGTYKPGYGYYETLAGGAGAGPGWKGTSGVHVHMTNTRITDPEIFERRYPCLLREFSLRASELRSSTFFLTPTAEHSSFCSTLRNPCSITPLSYPELVKDCLTDLITSPVE